MALVRPTLKVLAAFGAPVFPVSPTWTDISAYVLSCSGGGGKQHEEDRYEATQATILLDNGSFPGDPAGRFSPWNTAGPYYGHLTPDTPVKIEAAYGSNVDPEFFGYADSWKPVWVGPGFSNIELACSDGLKQLSLFGLQTLAYEDAVIADGPDGWWRLGDAANTTFPVDSSGNGRNAQLMGVATFGVQGPLLFDTNTAVDLTAGSSPAMAAGYVKCPGFSTTGTWSFEIWFKTTVNGGTIATLWGATGHDMELVVSGPLNAVQLQGAGLSFDVAGGASVTDGNWHHVAVAVTGTGPYTVTLYVDGASQGTTTTTSTNNTPSRFILLGGVFPFAPAFEGSISDAVVYGPASPAAHIAGRAALGQYFAQPVSSGARIGQVLTLAGVDSSLQSLDTGSVNVAAETSPVTGDQALDYIGTCRDTEAGEFWQDPAGTFQFRDRYNPATLTTPNIVFSDDDSVPGAYFNLGDPDIERDDLDLWTRIVISRTGGIDQTAGTGTRGLTVSTLLETDIEALSLAQWKFVHNGVAIDRVQGLTADAFSTDGGNTPGGTFLTELLGLAFEERVTVRKKTVDGSQAFQQDSLVEYVGFAWTPTSLLFTFRFSAIPLVGGPWFTADVSAADGTDVLAG